MDEMEKNLRVDKHTMPQAAAHELAHWRHTHAPTRLYYRCHFRRIKDQRDRPRQWRHPASAPHALPAIKKAVQRFKLWQVQEAALELRKGESQNSAALQSPIQIPVS